MNVQDIPAIHQVISEGRMVEWEINQLQDTFDNQMKKLLDDGVDELSAIEIVSDAISELPNYLVSFEDFLIDGGYSQEDARLINNSMSSEGEVDLCKLEELALQSDTLLETAVRSGHAEVEYEEEHCDWWLKDRA